MEIKNKKINYSIIAAMDENNLIGNNNEIPWHIPQDFKHFKEKTSSQIVIMGRNTFESLPKSFRPLPNRENIVISRNENLKLENVIVKNSIENALIKANKIGKQNKKIFVIGGANIYEQTIEDANKLYISHVKGSFSGNVYFPKINYLNYNIEKEEEYTDFIFRLYKKI